MKYRIIDQNGAELDSGHWHVRSHILARRIEEYCQSNECEFVKMRPNSTFTEIVITVKNGEM